VPLPHYQRKVQHQRAGEQGGHQHDVEDIEARDQIGGRVLASEDEVRDPGADHRYAKRRRVDDPKADAAEQIVGQGVAGQPVREREDQQHEADEVVELARAAKGAGEEDPAKVDHDRGDEHQRGPVMRLPHQQPRADLEGQPHDRVERRGHPGTVERGVGSVVDGLPGVRCEKEHEIDSGQDDDDEREQRDLAEQKGPVVWEHPSKGCPRELYDPDLLVDPMEQAEPSFRATSFSVGAWPTKGDGPGARSPRARMSVAVTLPGRAAVPVAPAVAGAHGSSRLSRGSSANWCAIADGYPRPRSRTRWRLGGYDWVEPFTSPGRNSSRSRTAFTVASDSSVKPTSSSGPANPPRRSRVWTT
jgi:hypothetical protein